MLFPLSTVFENRRKSLIQHCERSEQHFQKTRQNWPFLAFLKKCKRSSLRSQCWMRLFLWFSNTVDKGNSIANAFFLFLFCSGVFLAYASIILVALLISLSASISSFVLREAIAHRFSKTDVTSQLKGYATDPFLRSRWDSIQREFRCCGGYNVGSGYQDWEGVSVEPLPIGANPAALITGKTTLNFRAKNPI